MDPNQKKYIIIHNSIYDAIKPILSDDDIDNANKNKKCQKKIGKIFSQNLKNLAAF